MAFCAAALPAGRLGNGLDGVPVEAADRQIRYYPANYPASCFARLGLFGLSAAEVPDPSLVLRAASTRPSGWGDVTLVRTMAQRCLARRS